VKHSDKGQRFFERLLAYSAEPDAERRRTMEKGLWEDFGVKGAVFVLDMSGFSLLTQRYGIIHYLSLVRRMQATTDPIIQSHGGKVVKYQADNCFARFPDTREAVEAAVALNLAFTAENIITPPELDISISCGIDYGDFLLIEEDDLYGNAVNMACKLGEDLASPGEILVTAQAMERVTGQPFRYDPVDFNVSGVRIEACSVRFRAGE